MNQEGAKKKRKEPEEAKPKKKSKLASVFTSKKKSNLNLNLKPVIIESLPPTHIQKVGTALELKVLAEKADKKVRIS